MAQEGAPVQRPVFFSWEEGPQAQSCQIGPFALYLFPTSGIHRSLPQVAGVEAEPRPGVEEKQPWGRRLEHLQRAVAQLEIERSRLQRHNVQLRTTLEQVTSPVLSSLLHGPVCMHLYFSCSPQSRAW